MPWFHIVTLLTKVAGRQFRLEVAGDECFIDLLFYHTRLKCYVVAEYALSGLSKPICVANYELVRALPLDTNLPSIEEIEAELQQL